MRASASQQSTHFLPDRPRRTGASASVSPCCASVPRDATTSWANRRYAVGVALTTEVVIVRPLPSHQRSQYSPVRKRRLNGAADSHCPGVCSASATRAGLRESTNPPMAQHPSSTAPRPFAYVNGPARIKDRNRTRRSTPAMSSHSRRFPDTALNCTALSAGVHSTLKATHRRFPSSTSQHCKPRSQTAMSAKETKGIRLHGNLQSQQAASFGPKEYVREPAKRWSLVSINCR
jgi:hypothetical protein